MFRHLDRGYVALPELRWTDSGLQCVPGRTKEFQHHDEYRPVRERVQKRPTRRSLPTKRSLLIRFW